MSNFTEVTEEFNLEMWSNFLDIAIVDIRMKVIYVIITCCVTITSLSGNLLTCIVIYYDKSMHTLTNRYLFILAVSDLMLTFTIFVDIHDQVTETKYKQFACKVQYFASVSLWNYSILTMTALSIERFMAVYYPLNLRSSPLSRRVLKVMLMLWLVAMLETAPEMLTVELIMTRQSSLCFTIPTRFARILNGVLALLTFFVPLVIMIAAYSMIIFKVNAKQQKSLRNTTFNYKSPRGRANMLIIMMSVSLLVCWLPFFIMRVMIAVVDVKDLNNLKMVWMIVFRVVAICTWFCVVLNPIVFSIGSTKFKKSLKTLWNSKIRRQQGPNEYLQQQRSERVSYLF